MKRNIPHTGLRAFQSAFLVLSIVLSFPAHALPGAGDIATRSTASSPINAEPGKTISVGFIVANQATTERTVWAQVQIPGTWRVVLNDPPFTLGPGSSDLRLVTVAIPATAAEGVYEIRYVAAPADSPADTSVALTTIRIPGVRKISVKHSESPRNVVSGSTYRSTFVLTNHGNSPETIRLRATGLEDRYRIRLDAATMQLAPQESRMVTVAVETELNGGYAYYYRVDLSAHMDSDTSITESASSTVQILPGMQAIEARYQNFPLLTTLRWGGEGNRSGPQFELAGMGALNIEGTDFLEVLVRTPDLQNKTILGYRDEYRLAFKSENLEAFAGDRNFVLSPLTEFGRYAFGGGLRYQSHGVSISALANRDRYLDTHPQEAGGSVGVEVLPDAEVAVNYLYRRDVVSSNIVTARTLLNNLFGTFADIEAGRDFGDGNDNALSLLWRGRGDWGSFSATYIYAGPGYHSYYNDVDFKSAGITLFPLRPFHIDFNYRDEKRNVALDPGKFSAPRARYYEVGIGYSNYLSVYYRSNGYSDRLPNPRYDRRDNSILVQAGYAATRLGILGQFETGTQKDDIQGYASPFRRYALISSLAPSPSQSYGLTVEFEQRRGLPGQPAYDRLSGSLQAGLFLTGGTRAIVHFFGSQNLSGIEQNLTYLDLGLEHRLPFNHIIGIHARQSTYSPSPQPRDLAYRVEYTVPLALPLKYSSASGSLRGTFRDAVSGSPVEGAILLLDGAAVLTDPSGQFLFPDVKPGNHSLQVDHAGIGMEYVTVPQLPLEINVTGDPIDLDIQLVRGATAEGAVALTPPGDTTATDSSAYTTGKLHGIPDLLIELTSGSRMQRRRTDSGGRFDFKGLPPGQWHLRILNDVNHTGYIIRPDTAVFTLKPGDHYQIMFTARPVERQIRILDQGKVLKENAASPALATPPPSTTPPKIPHAPSARVVPASMNSGYAVLVSSSTSQPEARKQAALFGEALGIRAEVQRFKQQGKKTAYRVLVGSFASKADAEAMAAVLRSAKE